MKGSARAGRTASEEEWIGSEDGIFGREEREWNQGSQRDEVCVVMV
jgi:hypothetical protein